MIHIPESAIAYKFAYFLTSVIGANPFGARQDARLPLASRGDQAAESPALEPLRLPPGRSGRLRSPVGSGVRQNLPERSFSSLHHDLLLLAKMIPDQQNHAHTEGDKDQKVQQAKQRPSYPTPECAHKPFL